MDTEKLEAIQNVVDRVSSYQEGATEGTVEKELRTGLDEAGIDLDDQDVSALTAAIEENPGEARAADVLD
jgi:hypothetical protein